jgi:hypothetical protein
MSDAGGDTFFITKKLKGALPMTNDNFGAVVTVDADRVYVSAPYRNEKRRAAGAIFVCRLRINRASIAFAQIPKVTLKEAMADDWLGGIHMKVRNGIIYMQTRWQSGRDIVTSAFHPPTELTPCRAHQTFGINLTGAANGNATWESTTNLNLGWEPGTAVDPDASFQLPIDQPARYFRIRTPSAL